MDPIIIDILDMARDGMAASIKHLEAELLKIRAGRASAVMLNGVMVEAYGMKMPLNQVGSITTPDPRTIAVSPFDKSTIGAIERGIIEANLGFNPMNDGIFVRVQVPIPTEERRRDLAKQAKAEGEHAKVSIRNVRREHNDELKKLKDEGVSEDMIKNGEEAIQKITNEFTARVDEILKDKEKEIMTI